jgi:anaerobic magnesium-protoporphyrin IX monomethyl ester cyclase
MVNMNFPVNFIIVLGGDLVRSSEHLGVGYLAAVLRKHGYPAYIDEYRGSDELVDLINLLRARKIKLIGFPTTVVNIQKVIELSRVLKQELHHVIIVYGGHVATFQSEEEMFKLPEWDILVRGEGEETLLELVQTLETHGHMGFVKGIVYRDYETGQVVKNPERSLIQDLNNLPFPTRDQFERYGQKYHYMRICSSRGCYGSCYFCSNFVGRKIGGQHWRGRSFKNVVDEIEFLVSRYNFHTFDFVDSTFEDPPGLKGKIRIKAIAEEIIRRGLNIYYNCCFRSENWSESDHELLNLLVKSGLEKVNVGFEAGNDRGLQILGKHATEADNRRLISILARHPEVYLTFGFIFYHPYQTFEDLKDNARFLFESGMGHITRHYLWPLEVYPGTKIRERLIADNLYKPTSIIEDPYSYDFLHPEIKFFAKRMMQYLKEEAVWDFEIFDIVIHTYIYRLLRYFGDDPSVRGLVEEFREWLANVRSEIAVANYEFFCNWLEVYENGQEGRLFGEAERFNIAEYLVERKEAIQARQLRLSMALKRKGIPLAQISR